MVNIKGSAAGPLGNEIKLEDVSKEDLVDALRELLERGRSLEMASDEAARVLLEVHVHEIELETQNRHMREAQSSLEESRSKYVELYDFAPIAYATLDRTGLIEEINLTGATLLGQDRARLIGMPLASAVQFEAPSAFLDHLYRCSESRTPFVSELRLKTPRGGLIDVQIVSTPVRDATGKTRSFRTTLSDITARRSIERDQKRLHDLETALRHRFECLDRASVALTAALARGSGADLTDFFQTVVDQAREITGAGLAALWIDASAGRPFNPRVFSGIDDARVSSIAAFARDDKTLRLRDLREHPALAGSHADPAREDGFLGVPVRFGDQILGQLYLTNKRGAEEFCEDDEHVIEMLATRVGLAMQIAQLNQRLHDSVHSRESLLAIVAHDLRSPLNVIQIAAQRLERGGAGAPKEGATDPIKSILRNVGAMDRLIDDLLQASMIEAGRFTVEREPADIRAIVAETIEQMAPLAQAKAVELEADIAQDLPSIHCDRQGIVRVLSNLVGNSIKFTPARGQIHVRVERMSGDKLSFAVADTGAGIPEAEKPSLFERHWKGARGQGHGSGLGLYIAKGIVVAHGGAIWVESESGVGTTFFFTLPIAARD